MLKAEGRSRLLILARCSIKVVYRVQSKTASTQNGTVTSRSVMLHHGVETTSINAEGKEARGHDHRGSERMFTWCTARSPAEWDEAWAKAACALFLAQTGETYTPRSLASLPVPTWDGNLMLLEHGPDEALTEVGPDRLRGLLWTTPFQGVDLRVVAFAVEASLQGQGLGGQGWDMAVQAGQNEGLTGLRLEVREDNQGAIRFYERRGLSAEGELHDYYTDGVGLLMRGPMPSTPPWEG